MAEYSSPETAERIRCLLVRQSCDGRCAASVRDIAQELSIGRQTAINGIRRLVDAGQVRVLRKGSGNLYPTLYEVALSDGER